MVMRERCETTGDVSASILKEKENIISTLIMKMIIVENL